jgi:hypothetical protein
MEPDEQGQAEETAVVETPEQTAVTEDSGSEAAQTQSEETGKGDLRVPLKEEREKRQRLEQSLNDPNFIYERARALGLAQGEEPTTSTPAVPDISAQVKRQVRVEKVLEKYPEVQTDEKLQLMVTALINGGLDPVDAADEVFSRMKRTEEKAKVEAAQQAKAEIGEREKAQMAGNTVRMSSETERMSDIQKGMRSPDKHTQEAATIEWLKELNKKRGIE